MKYTVTMTTTLVTESLVVIKERLDDLTATFPDNKEFDPDDYIGQGEVILQTTEEPEAKVTTSLRIDCDRSENPKRADYPTAGEVKAASPEQIGTWFKELPMPLCEGERKILAKVWHRRRHPQL